MSDGKPIALEDRGEDGGRLFSPSAGRNREVVRDVLVRFAPVEGDVLEVGAGTGEHAVTFAAALPGVRWRPGDPDAASRASIAAWVAHTGLTNVASPHAIDVSAADWDGPEPGSLAGIVSLNMVHISPFDAAQGLLAGAGRYLGGEGMLFLYGPFARDGAHTAPSNAAFDENLKSRDARWGVRDLDREIVPLAERAGLALAEVVEMPANNLSVVFRKLVPGR